VFYSYLHSDMTRAVVNIYT